MTNNQMDLIWQIFILTDTNRSILVTINKQASVARLFEKFRAENRDFQWNRRLTFLLVDGLELQEDDKTGLADVGRLRNRSNIQLIVHVDGGVWPTEIEIRTQIRNPYNVPSLAGLITTDLEDVMGLDDESPCVKMSCGHAVAPSSLAFYCYFEIQKGAPSIRCPAPGCDAVWSFTSIIDAACLSLSETSEFERKMLSNRLDESCEIKKCPGCGNSCRRLDENETRICCRKCSSDQSRNFDFCWTCLKEWKSSINAILCGNQDCGDHTLLFKQLATCDTIKLNEVECPARRACPNCFMLIEYIDRCKHMKCPIKRCKYDFCFICLKHYPCGTGPYEACSPAPRQQTISPPPPPPKSSCSIL